MIVGKDGPCLFPIVAIGLLFAGAHGLVLEVFRITRIDTIIPFYADLAAACAAFNAASATA